jgi:starch synthase (maltosyl-transferring)
MISISATGVAIDTGPEQTPILDPARQRKTALRNATQAPRIVIDDITPRVDGGPFAAKRVIGQTVTV